MSALQRKETFSQYAQLKNMFMRDQTSTEEGGVITGQHEPVKVVATINEDQDGEALAEKNDIVLQQREKMEAEMSKLKDDMRKQQELDM